jgi:hypothetical protein
LLKVLQGNQANVWQGRIPTRKGTKMKFRIHYGYLNKETHCYENEDSIVTEGDTIEEIRQIAADEIRKRGAAGIYSEEL